MLFGTREIQFLHNVLDTFIHHSAEVVAQKVTPPAPKSLIDKIWNEDTKVSNCLS
jgi:hypothetical protein